jgi:parvulin-like peptidyl-prolyl isomerase
MKRLLVFFSFLALSGAVISAQAIDKPAATVRLTKPETITVRQVKEAVDPYEKNAGRTFTAAERRQFLDGLITRKLIEQAAERDKIPVTDAEIKAEIDLQKKSMAATLGRDPTDAEFQAAIKSSGTTLEKVQSALRYQILTVKYAKFKNPDIFSKIPQPTDAEVKAFYDANKTKYFVWPDIARVKWILVDTRNLTQKDERDKAAKRAEDIYRELKSGAKFEDLVAKYSDDTTTKYKGGDLGYLQRGEATQAQLLGADFMEAVFGLKKGETSGILTSSVGFAIVQVTERMDAKIASLDDKYPPAYTESVTDRIKAILLQNKQSEAYTKTLMDIADKLKKEAEIKIFEENLNW